MTGSQFTKKDWPHQKQTRNFDPIQFKAFHSDEGERQKRKRFIEQIKEVCQNEELGQIIAEETEIITKMTNMAYRKETWIK